MSFLTRNSNRVVLALSLTVFLTLAVRAQAAPPQAANKKPAAAPSKTAKKAARKAPVRRRAASWRTGGQQGINAARAREIQEALIRENYLDGRPDGVWGTQSQEAMARYQADQGWQSRVVPDSRALIRLGLGPDRSAVLNPESLRSSLTPKGISQD